MALTDHTQHKTKETKKKNKQKTPLKNPKLSDILCQV